MTGLALIGAAWVACVLAVLALFSFEVWRDSRRRTITEEAPSLDVLDHITCCDDCRSVAAFWIERSIETAELDYVYGLPAAVKRGAR